MLWRDLPKNKMAMKAQKAKEIQGTQKKDTNPNAAMKAMKPIKAMKVMKAIGAMKAKDTMKSKAMKAANK